MFEVKLEEWWKGKDEGVLLKQTGWIMVIKKGETGDTTSLKNA